MKRLVSTLTLSTSLLVSASASAVPASLTCADDKATNCVRGDVFIMEGTPDLLRDACRSLVLKDAGIKRWNCRMNFDKVAKKFTQILKDKNVTNRWDQLAIFSVDSTEPTVFGSGGVFADGAMMFFRTGMAPGVDGVNEIVGIGIPKKAPDLAIPYTGYITAGSTTTFGIWQPPLGQTVPQGLKWWPLPDPAGTQFESRYRNCDKDSLCYDGFNGYQALAQATSQMFGPFLREEVELQSPDNWYAFSPLARSACAPDNPNNLIAVPTSLVPKGGSGPDGGASDGGTTTGALPKSPLVTGGLELLDLSQLSGTRVLGSDKVPLKFGEPALSVCPQNRTNLALSIRPGAVPYDPVKGTFGTASGNGNLFGKMRPRVWNSFMDMDGSLMGGGANWIENGNFTATTGGPNAFQAASPPYRGRKIVIFNSLENWLMGFEKADDIKVDIYNTRAQDMQGEGGRLGYFTGSFGPRMGLPKLIAIGLGPEPLTIFSDGRKETRNLTELLGGPPARDPDFVASSHSIKQLWIVVTKPEDKILPASDDRDECKEGISCDTGNLASINHDHVEHMLRWRRAWQQNFYLLTSYRGRMSSTFDQTYDDSAYWEFMQKDDDSKTFVQAGDLSFVVSGPRKDITSAAILSYANVSTPGKAGTMTFAAHPPQQLPTRIDGRLVERVWRESPENKKFVVSGDNALLVRMALPKKDPEEAKALKAEATLTLSNGPTIRIPGDKNSFLVFDGKFHTYAVDLRRVEGYAGEGKTYDGFSFSPSSVPVTCDTTLGTNPGEEDFGCLKLDYIRFTNVPDPDDAGDFDADCDGTAKPDGYIGLEDNCPKLYNPGQEDADGNGVGDDCEDFDLDAIVNRCDNCPTLTNARQGDRDKDKLGDICDEDFRGGCFLQPDSVAGSNGGNPAVIPLALLGLSLAGVFAFRMKRRRKR